MIFPTNPTQNQLSQDQDVIFLKDDELCFSDETEKASQELLNTELTPTNAWNIIIIDDEPDVHRATQLALNNVKFEDRKLTFFSAYSGKEGKDLLAIAHTDAALVILDVVMETNDAGLKVVQ